MELSSPLQIDRSSNLKISAKALQIPDFSIKIYFLSKKIGAVQAPLQLTKGRNNSFEVADGR